MPDPIIYFSPDQLAAFKRRYPIHWREILNMIEADAIIKRGGAHPRFVVLASYRMWELMLGIYDPLFRSGLTSKATKSAEPYQSRRMSDR